MIKPNRILVVLSSMLSAMCFLTSCLKVDGVVEGSSALLSLTNITQLPAPFNGMGCVAGEVALWDGTGWTCELAASGADNLGDHTATQNLNMGAFSLVGAGGTEGLRVDSAGRVSIRMTTPATANLEVDSSFAVRNVAGSAVTVSPTDVSMNAAASSVVGLSLQDPNKHWALRKDANNTLNFFDVTDNTTRMMIHGTTGHVGVGTSGVQPLTKLEVRGSNAGNASFGPGQGASSGLLVNNQGSGGDGVIMGLNLSSGGRNNNSNLGWYFNILGVNTAYNVGTDSLVRVGTAGGFNHSQAITFSADGARTGGARLSFWTGANVANPSERMSILNSNGNIGIGIINPADRLQVFGDVRVGNAATNGCLKDFSGGTITGTCTSDERLKKNFRNLGSVSEKLTQITPKFYQWRSSEFPEKRFGEHEELGLVAQDLLRVLPELVTKDSEGLYRVRYQQLPMYLIKAFKEQQDMIRESQDEIANLKAELAEIKSLLLNSGKNP